VTGGQVGLTRRPLLFVLAALLLAACATPTPPGTVRSYAGKFSLQLTGGDHQQSMSGRFAMSVDGEHVTLDLATPLGNTVARVNSRPGRAQLTVPGSDGPRTEEGSDPDALSQRVLGWTLPVAGLPDWIEGRPTSSEPYRLEPAQDGGSILQQQGWEIRFDPRGQDGRIRRLQLDRAEQGQAPSVHLRVVLDPEEKG
jgi:outer membrane lipoprotein LolB